MSNSKLWTTFAAGAAVAIIVVAIAPRATNLAHAQTGSLTALDYHQITQLINRYAYGIDTCANDGYDYADVFTDDGVFVDRNSDAGFAAGGRVLARGREALAELVGGAGRAGARRSSSGPTGAT